MSPLIVSLAQRPWPVRWKSMQYRKYAYSQGCSAKKRGVGTPFQTPNKRDDCTK